MTRLHPRFRRLLQRPEARHVGILASGSIAAQIVLVGTTPLLSRLYGPSHFGLFALLLTVSTIGGAVGGLSYEMAVILPRSQRMAQALYALSLVLSVFTAGFTVCVVAVLQRFFPSVLGTALDATFYGACFFSTALLTQFNALGYAHSRAGQYGAIAVSKVTQTVLPALAQIGLAFAGLGASGLTAGRALGLLGSDLWLCRKLPKGFRLRDLPHVRPAAMLTAARSYRDFLYQVPRQVLVRGSTMMPSALLLGAYGPVVAGLYFFAARLVERPGMLLGDALSRVPMKQFAERRKRGVPLTRAALLYTLAVGLPVVLGVAALALLAHPLFHFVFGRRWVPAADYAVVLAGWAAIRLASLPMATLTTVVRLQRISFYVDAVFAPRVFVIPVLAAHGAGPLAAVAAFCALSVCYHILVFAVGLWAAMKHDRELRAPRVRSGVLPEAEATYG
ncbi:MAG TPA: oligosaccharide flippase family protein [Rhizomicrobium sp.]|nr:oligosaccharide flippase family protein [Rhizomicrobium sp.]